MEILAVSLLVFLENIMSKEWHKPVNGLDIRIILQTGLQHVISDVRFSCLSTRKADTLNGPITPCVCHRSRNGTAYTFFRLAWRFPSRHLILYEITSQLLDTETVYDAIGIG